MSAAGWAYADRDPWHGEYDQEDEYRIPQGRTRTCRECEANLDIDGHEPWCSQTQEGASDE